MLDHTPGPWEARPVEQTAYTMGLPVEVFAGKEVVARVYAWGPSKRPEALANARLIAQAWLIPELAEALRLLVEFLDTFPESFDVAHDSERERLRRARALLAKLDTT